MNKCFQAPERHVPIGLFIAHFPVQGLALSSLSLTLHLSFCVFLLFLIFASLCNSPTIYIGIFIVDLPGTADAAVQSDKHKCSHPFLEQVAGRG